MPEEDEQAYSILDPIKQKGVIKGGLQLAASFIPGAMAGAQARANATDGFTVGSVFSGLGEFGKEAAFYTPGVGELLGARLGMDVMDDNTDLFTKGVSAMGIIGLPMGALAGGAAIKGALGASGAAAGAGYRRGILGNQHPQRGYVDGMPVTVDFRKRDALSALGGAVSTPVQYHSIIPLLGERRQRLLLGVGQLTGPIADLKARWVSMTEGLLGGRKKNTAQVEGFMEGMGEIYYDLIPDVAASAVGQGMDVGKAKLAYVAHEFSKFDTAIEKAMIVFPDDVSDVGIIWKKMLDGETLDGPELAELTGALTQFAEMTVNLGHPEMVLMDPRFAVHSIVMDPDNPRLALSVVPFDPITEANLFETEMTKRLHLMMTVNPEGMVPLMTQNLVDFVEMEVMPNWDRLKSAVPGAFRGEKVWAAEWYRLARQDTYARANDIGFEPDRLVGIASLMSAGELWESNIEKAVRAAQYMLRNPKWTEKGLWRHMNQGGYKSTTSEIANVARLMEAPDATEHFRQMLPRDSELKQPNFTEAILKSEDHHLKDQTALMYAFMTGRVTPEQGGSAFNRLDMTVPLVVDRHAIAAAMGFSMSPSGSVVDSGYRPAKAAFVATAQAIGEVPELGRAFTPSEVQALVWVMWRERRGVTENFIPVNASKRLRRQLLGLAPNAKVSKGKGLPKLWIDGQGPSYTVSDRILKFLTDPLPEGAMDYTQPTAPMPWMLPEEISGLLAGKEARRRSGSVRDVGTVILSMGRDGAHWVTPEGAGPVLNRIMKPTVARTAAGQTIMAPARARKVASVKTLFDRLGDETLDATGVGGVTGARMLTTQHRRPGMEPGHHVAIGTAVNNGSVDGRQAHLRMQEILAERGIEFEVHIDEPHQGPTRIWSDGEGNDFWSAADMEHAVAQGIVKREDLALTIDVEDRVQMVITLKNADDVAKVMQIAEESSAVRRGSLTGHGDPVNVPAASQAAAGYVRRHGREFGLSAPVGIRRFSPDGKPISIQADEGRAQRAAAAYAALGDKPLNKKARKSYEQAATEIAAQYDFITNDPDGPMLEVVFVADDPYKTPLEMAADIKDNGRLKILKTAATGGHPFWDNETNDMLRAVHDYFGHSAMGNNFSRHGEELALAKHLQMFSSTAAPAIISDLLGNNAWLTSSKHNRRRFMKHLRETVNDKIMTKRGHIRKGATREQNSTYTRMVRNGGATAHGDSPLPVSGERIGIHLDLNGNAGSGSGLGKAVGFAIKRQTGTSPHKASSGRLSTFVEMVPISWFDDVEGNPLRYDVDELASSIKAGGIDEPLVIDFNPKTGSALLSEGNHRLAAARKAGLTEVPVAVSRNEHAWRGTAKLKVLAQDDHTGDWTNLQGERLGGVASPSEVGIPTLSPGSVDYGTTAGHTIGVVMTDIGVHEDTGRMARARQTKQRSPGASMTGTLVRYDTPDVIWADIPTDARRLDYVRTGGLDTQGYWVDVETGRAFKSADNGVGLSSSHSPVKSSRTGEPTASTLVWGNVELGDTVVKPGKGLAPGFDGDFPPQKVGILPDEFMPDDAYRERVYDTRSDQGRTIDDIYKEQILDLVAYTDGDQAPAGTTAVLEHHFEDDGGNVMVHNSRQGDPNAKNVVTAYVVEGEYGMDHYVSGGKTESHVTGHAGPGFSDRDGQMFFGDSMVVANPSEVKGSASARHLFEVKLVTETVTTADDVKAVKKANKDRKKPKKLPKVGTVISDKTPSRIAMYAPEGGLAHISYNTDTVQVPGLGRAPAGRSVVLTLKSGNFEAGSGEITIHAPGDPLGALDSGLIDDVRDLLTENGWRGRITQVAQ